MQEQQPNAQPANRAAGHEQQEQHLKTLAVRIEEGLHTQMRFIAQLSNTSLNEEIRRAIEQRIASAQEDPALIARAERARAEIEREAAARTAAIAGFIGDKATAATSVSAAKPTRATAKTAEK